MGNGLLGALAGGVKGYGDALVSEAQKMREQRLADQKFWQQVGLRGLEHKNRFEELKLANQNATARDQSTQAHQRSLLDKEYGLREAATKNEYGLREAATTKEYGLKTDLMEATAKSQSKGMGPLLKEAREYAAAKAKRIDQNGLESVDQAAFDSAYDGFIRRFGGGKGELPEGVREAGADTPIRGDVQDITGMTAAAKENYRKNLPLGAGYIDGGRTYRKASETDFPEAAGGTGEDGAAILGQFPDAKRAKDGKWYVERDGRFMEVRPKAGKEKAASGITDNGITENRKGRFEKQGAPLAQMPTTPPEPNTPRNGLLASTPQGRDSGGVDNLKAAEAVRAVRARIKGIGGLPSGANGKNLLWQYLSEEAEKRGMTYEQIQGFAEAMAIEFD